MNISGDGKLSLMTNPTVSAGNGPNGLCISPDGRYVYVVNSSDDNISQFTIGVDGGLELITSPVTTGDLPASVVIDQSGTYVYSVNAGDATISRFSIENNPLPGALNALPPSTVIGTAEFPTQIAIDPSGKFIYIVDNSAAGGVWQYNINSSDGSLTAMTPVSVSSGSYSQYIAILEK
jgi:6-phosphogluconolactonase